MNEGLISQQTPGGVQIPQDDMMITGRQVSEIVTCNWETKFRVVEGPSRGVSKYETSVAK